MPVFNCTGEMYSSNVTKTIESFVFGGVGCRLIGFEKCGIGNVCNVNASAVITRNPQSVTVNGLKMYSSRVSAFDSLSGNFCVAGRTGRLCAECVRKAPNNVYFSSTTTKQCEKCPKLEYSQVYVVFGVAICLQAVVYVFTPNRLRRWCPPAQFVIWLLVLAWFYVTKTQLVLGNLLSFVTTMSFLRLIAERKRRLRKPGILCFQYLTLYFNILFG